MSVEKFKELGREGYAAWRLNEIAARKIRKPGEVVYIEVEKEVIVDRYLDAPADIQMPDFMRYDPLSEFLANEANPGETDEATLARLRAEIVELFAMQRDGDMAPDEHERLRHLTAHIQLTGD
jgi:hypothetical protein